MSLLNPLLFVIGAAALAIPLWVHLRLGKVKKRALVGSLRLLRASPQTSRNPRRLIKRPLFLLRCLITLLIALGFAQLVLPWLGKDTSLGFTAIVLDASGSMQAKNGTGTSWSIAQQAALTHLDRLSPSARVAVFVSPSDGKKPEWTEPSKARDIIRKLRPGFSANQLHAEILAASAALKSMPSEHSKTLHIISDFQKLSFTEIDQATIPQSVQLELTKTSPEHPTNRGLAVTVSQVGAANLRLYSFNDATPGTISLNENNASSSISIRAGSLVSTPTSSPFADGFISRKFSITESDDLSVDNVALDLFRPQQEIPVWLWEPQLASAPKHSETENFTYFLARALQPTEIASDGVSLFRPKAVTIDNLSVSAFPPLLLIPAQESYPEGLATAANAITLHGGSVVFFGGKKLTPKSLLPFGNLPPVTPDSIEKVPLYPALAKIEANHPLFGSLGVDSRVRLASSPLLLRHSLTLKPSARVLASFADDMPFIVESDAGAGKVYFINTSADREFGDLPADAPRFIPAMHLLMARAIENKYQRTDDAPFIAGRAQKLQLDRSYAGKNVNIEGVKMTVDSDGSLSNLNFPEPGEKAILFEGAPIRRLVVNFPPTESTLDNLSEVVVRQRLEAQRRPDGGTSVIWENVASGQFAWQLCLLLGSLILLVEPLFADRKNIR